MRVSWVSFDLASVQVRSVLLYISFESAYQAISELPFFSCQNEFSCEPFVLKCIKLTGSFSYERFCGSTCFETEAQGNMAMLNSCYCSKVGQMFFRFLSPRLYIFPLIAATTASNHHSFVCQKLKQW